MSLSLVVIWGSEELGVVAAEKHGKSSEEKSGRGVNSCQRSSCQVAGSGGSQLTFPLERYAKEDKRWVGLHVGAG